MRLLCNLPLECFEERERYPEFDVVTFGPKERMWVDGVHFPFDVEFDPSEGTLEDLLARLPNGFTPDAILIWWPDQEPLPVGLERARCPVVGIISDYNLTLPHVAGLWPFFDLWLVDRPGVDLFRRLSFAAVEPFCQYTFKRPFHRLYADVERDLDLGFAGNLNPLVQQKRAPWLERLAGLRARGLSVEIRSGIFGEQYGRFLNRARIGWNHSIRGEINLRAFEVPACGALLMVEKGNLEVREAFVPGEEVVLYDEQDFEEQALRHAFDDRTRERIARAGHARVQQHTLAARLQVLAELIESRCGARPAASAAELALGRATALLSTWAKGDALLRAADAALAAAPEDPRCWNLRALAALRAGHPQGAGRIVADLGRSLDLSASYLPAAANLEHLFASGGRPDLALTLHAELERRLGRSSGWGDVDGPLLPLGCSARSIALAQALGAAVRAGDPAGLHATFLEAVSQMPRRRGRDGRPEVGDASSEANP